MIQGEKKFEDAELFAKQKIDEMDELIGHYEKLDTDFGARNKEFEALDRKLKDITKEHQKCATTIKSLKMDNAALLKGEKNLPNDCGDNCEPAEYLKALLKKIYNV